MILKERFKTYVSGIRKIIHFFFTVSDLANLYQGKVAKIIKFKPSTHLSPSHLLSHTGRLSNMH